MPYTCPVCGYPHLEEQPHHPGAGGSDEICPSCGTQFGYHDGANDDLVWRTKRHEVLRRKWIAGGMKWHSKVDPVPGDWKPETQLRNIEP